MAATSYPVETDPIAAATLIAHNVSGLAHADIRALVAGAVDASLTVKGVAKITPAPVSPTNPVSVGSNHPALSDARTPLAHAHAQADVTALATALADAKARANHTGTQTSATIADFTEAVQDAVATLLGAGSNVTLTYNDASDTLTIAAADTDTTDPEAVRDAIGIALVGAGLISVGVNDGADTITISTTATANATDAQLRDRALHTGAQTIATVTGLQGALDAKVAGPGSAISGNLATYSGTTGKLIADAGVTPASLVIAGDATGTLAAASVVAVRGKPVPAPGAGQDGKGWYYDHGTGAFVFGISPQTQTALDLKLNASEKAAASGVASLSSGSRVVQLPKLHATDHQLGGGDALDLPQYDLDQMLPGVMAPNLPWVSPTATTITAGRVYYARFVVSRPMTITLIGFVVTVVDTVDSAVHVGITDAAHNRLATSGAVTGKLNSTGGKTVTLSASVALSPRTVYYAAWLAPTVTTAPQIVVAMGGNASMWTLYGASAPNRTAAWLDGQTAIPATAAPTSPTSANGTPMMAVRET